MFKLVLEKAEEPIQIANIRWIIEKAREFQKNNYFCFIDYAKAFDCVGHNKQRKSLKEMGIPDHLAWLLRVPCTPMRSNQSILKKISPEYSLEALMLKLKLQYFGHLMRRTDSFEKTLMLGKIEPRGEGDDRGWDGWMASLTRWTWVWASSGFWWCTVRPGVLQSMGSQRVGHDWVTELNWIETVDNAGIYA